MRLHLLLHPSKGLHLFPKGEVQRCNTRRSVARRLTLHTNRTETDAERSHLPALAGIDDRQRQSGEDLLQESLEFLSGYLALEFKPLDSCSDETAAPIPLSEIAKTFTPMGVFDVRLSAKGTVDFSFPARDNAGLLVMKGDVTVNGSKARMHDLVVFENVGEAVWGSALKSLVRGGRIVTCGATSGDQPGADLRRVFIRQLQIFGSTLGNPSELGDLLSWCAGGRVRPVIDSHFTLDQAHDALDRLEAGAQFGKIAIEVGAS